MKYKIILILITTCLILSVTGNIYQYMTNHKLNEQVSTMQETISSRETQASDLEAKILELSLALDAYENQKETYWTLYVSDYKVSLQEGSVADTMELIYCRDGEERLLLTFQKGDDYQVPEDISAEVFESCLGHTGFRLYKRCYLGSSSYYYNVEYYAMEEELELLASCWGDKHDGYYETDVDGDGINELICNVVYLADGAQSVFIYHFNGEQVLMGYGSDLLDEHVDNHGIGAIAAKYLPEKNKVHIKFWQDAIDGFQEKDYDIDLSKIDMYEVIR